MTTTPRYLPQCTAIFVKCHTEFKNPYSGRNVTLKAGQELWVCLAAYEQRLAGSVCVARKGHVMHKNWCFTWEDFDRIFTTKAPEVK